MPYREAPNVKSIQRKYFFPELFWLDPKYFKEIESKNEIKPSIIGSDGNKMYIGKTVPDNSDYNNPMSMHEIIGTVVKDLDGNLCLRVPYGSRVHTLTDNFVVLSIQDENSYHWIKESNGSIPAYALRGSLDNSVNEFLYIGRTILKNDLKGKYFGGYHMDEFNEQITQSIGKVHSSHQCLYVPIGNNEVALREYEVLCLKPSPASLKVLSRLVVRNKIGQDVNNMKEKFQNRLPLSIIKYLEYPTSLSYGEYMLKGEKLLSECGNFELFINNENQHKDNEETEGESEEAENNKKSLQRCHTLGVRPVQKIRNGSN